MANLLQSILSLFAFVLMPLNLLGGIISGIWLAILGEWSLIVSGISADIAGPFFLTIPLLLTIALSVPGQALIEKGKLFAGTFFALLSLLVTYSIIAVWCLGVFYVFLSHRTASNSFPLLLWIFSTATGPWTYMASREGNNPGASISLLSTHLSMLGAITTYWISESSFTASLAFLSALGVGFAVHLAATLTLAAQSRTSSLEERAQPSFADYPDGTTVEDISTPIRNNPRISTGREPISLDPKVWAEYASQLESQRKKGDHSVSQEEINSARIMAKKLPQRDEVSFEKQYSQKVPKDQAEICLRFYFHGEGTVENGAEALAWLHRAAKQGNADAQHTLATFYTIGCGVAQDEKEAAKWCRKAAEQGLAEAQCSLGRLYQTGRGVTRDSTEAAKWYRQAAEQGDSDAQTSLGDLYRDGHGVQQNYTEAAKWYLKAAEQGQVDAQASLGVFYHHGEGVPQDDTQSATWYRKAAEQGQADAQRNLSTLYYFGQGVPRDYAEAYFWAFIATTAGARDSLGLCNKIAGLLTPQQISEVRQRARDWKAKT